MKTFRTIIAICFMLVLAGCGVPETPATHIDSSSPAMVKQSYERTPVPSTPAAAIISTSPQARIPTTVTTTSIPQSTMLRDDEVVTPTVELEDNSRLLMIVGHGPIELTLLDPQQRRLGYNPASPQVLEEIPYSMYHSVLEQNEKQMVIGIPTAGDYTLSITPISNGTYSVMGIYTDETGLASLFVKDGQAVVGMTHTQLVDVPQQAIDSEQPPEVAVSLDKSVKVGEPVSLNATYTDLNPNDTHQFRWDFGDGSNNTETLTPTHIYTRPGIYTATLEVTDNTGFTVSDEVIVTVTE